MKMLDFNAIQQPMFPVKLKDKNQTVVNLTAPNVELVDRLTAFAPELQAVTKKADGRTIKAIYTLFADIFNCNADCLTFTPDELRDVYKLQLIDLIVLEAAYMDFIVEIKNAKN